MTDFGNGPTLEQFNPWLRDEAERVERILDVSERNSVIEGLPPFSAELKREFSPKTQGRLFARDSARRVISTIGPYRRLKAALAASVVLLLPLVALIVDQQRPSRLCGKQVGCQLDRPGIAFAKRMDDGHLP